MIMQPGLKSPGNKVALMTKKQLSSPPQDPTLVTLLYIPFISKK